MKYFYILVLLVTINAISAAGVSARNLNPLDSLQRLLTSKKQDTNRVRVLCQLSNQYLYSNPAKALSSATEAVSISQKLHYSKGIANGYNSIGNYYYQTGDYHKALQYQQTSLRARTDKRDYYGLSKTYLNLGNAYYGLGNLKAASRMYFKGLKFAEIIKSTDLITMAYGNLANVYYDLKNFKEAIKITMDVIRMREKVSDYNGLSFSYNNAGLLYTEVKKYDLALKLLEKAVAASRRSDNKALLAYSWANIGGVYNKQGKYQLALNSQKKALAVQAEIDDKLGIVSTLRIVASIYFNLNDLPNAYRSYQTMVEMGKQLSDQRVLIDAYAGLSKVAEARKDYAKALQFHKDFMVAQDSILNQNNAKELSELRTKYETEKKAQQIALLNKENTIQKLSISKRNTAIMIIAGILVAIIAFSGLYYSRAKLKQEARLQQEILKQQDLATKAILEAEESERTRIAADLHDGLGQMFSTVKMNLSGIEDQLTFNDDGARSNFQNTILLVDESCREVRSISHQMAPNVLLKSGLVSAVRDFISKVDERRININLEVEGITERLDNNIEAVLYRVIQETVNNVIKHAKASKLDIQLVKDLDGLSVMIEDDGIGFDAKNMDKSGGFGLKNISSRIDYLKGTVDIDSSENMGTVVSIWIPIAV